MQLEFNGAEDFIERRINLLGQFQNAEKSLERRFNSMGNFAPYKLSREIDDMVLVLSYFVLKDLLENNDGFTYGVQGSNQRGQVLVNMEDDSGLLRLNLTALYPEPLVPIDFISQAYELLNGDRQAWLIGERRMNEGWESGDSEHRYNHPFDTKSLIRDQDPSLFTLLKPDEEGPRQNYDKTIYQRFISNGGFGPVAEFCSQFPYQFFQAIVTSTTGEIYLEPERKRNAGWDVTHYSVRADLKTSDDKLLTGIGRLLDDHLIPE